MANLVPRIDRNSVKDFLKHVRAYWDTDKESRIADAGRGISSSVTPPDTADLYGGYAGMMTSSGEMNLEIALRLDRSLMQRYRDYEEMDDYGESSAVLDMFADDTTVPDIVRNKTVWAVSEDLIVKNIIDDLLHRRLRIEEDIWGMARTLCKYGNCYAEIIVTKIGVVGLNFLSPPTMRRIHDKKGALIGFIQDVSGKFSVELSDVEAQLKRPRIQRDRINNCVIFEPWEVVHWRLQSKQIRAPYGWGVLDSARWIWRRLMMFEDSALVNKLTRAAARYAFYINVGDLDERRARAHVRKIQRGYQKKKLIDPSTGALDFRYNPLSPPEDFWIPTKDGKDSTRIETISGLDSQSMEDVEYFRDKFYTAMKVPKSFFGGEASMDRTSSQQDVRFARTAMRIQRELRNGLRQVNRIHLAALNIDPDLSEYDTEMAQPSYIFELAQVEVRNAQVALAEGYRELMPRDWIVQNVFGFSKDDSQEMVKKASDERHDDTIKSAATQAQIVRDYPEVAGMMGEELGTGEETVSEDITVNKVVKSDIKRLKELLESAIGASKDVSKSIKRVEPAIKKTYKFGADNRANSLSNKRRVG